MELDTRRFADTENNKRLISEFLTAFSLNPLTATVHFLDDAATWWVAGTLPASGDHSKGQILVLMKHLAAAFTHPLQVIPRAFTAEGDRVAVEAESYGETLDGRVYNNQYHFLFVVRDGKVHAVKEFMDTMHVQSVLFVS